MAGSNKDVQSQAVIPAKAGALKLIIAGVIVVVLAAGISFAVAMFASKSFSGDAAAKESSKEEIETIGATVEVGEFVTNLSSETGNRFIKTTIVIALKEEKVPEELARKKPQIQHVINSTLRQQSPEILGEPRGMETLAELLKKNINSLLAEAHVSHIFFTSFVVQ